jgi:NDP-sugar pyrophosphorylase family protein
MKKKDIIETISLENGKYTLSLVNNGEKLYAFRHDEFWRDLTGNKLALAMFQKIQELEK